MALTDGQIERYSRQIIVPRLGGIRQERIMRATMLLAGDARDIEAPLAYLAGAGVGTICVAKYADAAPLIETITTLNPEVRVASDDRSAGRVDVALVIAGDPSLLAGLADRKEIEAFVIARLDSAIVAVMPGKSPCPRCADHRLLAEMSARSDAADFIGMFATVEAIKLVAGYDENPAAKMFEFHGYDTKSRAAASSRGCACNVAG